MLPKVVGYTEKKHPVDEKQTEENIEQHHSTLHQSIAVSIKIDYFNGRIFRELTHRRYDAD
jgi:hypothetical protein